MNNLSVKAILEHSGYLSDAIQPILLSLMQIWLVDIVSHRLFLTHSNPALKDWYNKKVFSETFDIFNFKYVIWLEFLKTRYLYNSSL